MKFSPHQFVLLALIVVSFLVSSCEEDGEIIVPSDRLIADAGDDLSAVVDTDVVLDGSASRVSNNKPLTYQWTLRTRPAGSTATIRDASDARARFTPDVAGTYVFRLRISQQSLTADDEIIATVEPKSSGEPQTIVLPGDISAATTLTDVFTDPTRADYIVNTDVNVRADLTIAPGVVIEFQQDRQLQIISGSLHAVGTAENPIVLKGAVDQRSYWKGLVVHTNSPDNELRYVTIRDAGHSPASETTVRANLTLVGLDVSASAMKISHSVLSGSGGYGLFVQGMSVLADFSANELSGNQTAAAIPASQLGQVGAGTVITGNTRDAIETGGVMPAGTQATWRRLNGAYYYVSSNVTVLGKLTIEAGTALRMNDGITFAVEQEGGLNATGTAALPVVFTSSSANSHWNGIFINTSDANNKLVHTEVSRGGLRVIGTSAQAGNVVVGPGGFLTVQQSVIKDGLAFGVVAQVTPQINADVATANTFANLVKSPVFPIKLNYADWPSLQGVWLDQWSFNQSRSGIEGDFYDRQSGEWFAGAATPFEMTTTKGFGLEMRNDGTFTWIIADAMAMTGCPAFSAEYIEGAFTANDEAISFDQSYWRSKFVNPCDPSWNSDIGVTPQEIVIRYEITKMYNLWTGEGYWELKFINPDDSTFKFYRR